MSKRATDQTPDQFYAQLKKQKRQPKATIVAAVLLVVFLAVVFFAFPRHLPWSMQKLVGFVNAVLAATVAAFAVKEFGKKKNNTFDFLFLKKIDTAMAAGAGAFVLVAAWWLSPLAPIRAGVPAADEVARNLSDELTLAVLVMPDSTLAILEPPTPSSIAAQRAQQIPNDADPYAQLIKAIAERRYDAATLFADRAAQAGGDAGKVAVARGQLEVFAGRFTSAPPLFQKAVDANPTDGKVLAQSAVAWALAGNLTKAYEVASQLVDAARNGSIGDDKTLPMALNLKGAIAMSSGRFKEAVELTQESQLIWEDAAGDSFSEKAYKAASRNNQAIAYAMLPTKYAGAETQFNGALNLWIETYGPESSHVAGCRNNLGVLAIIQSRFELAEERLTQALELSRKVFPTRSAHWCSPMNALARLNTLFGRYESAQQFVDDADKAATDQMLLMEPALQATRGAIAAGRGSYAEASDKFRKALELGAEMFSPDHVFLGEVDSQLGAVNSVRGRFGETEQLCRTAIDIFNRQLGENHPLAACAYDNLGFDQQRAGKRSEARQQFEKARQILEANQREIGPMAESGRSLAGLALLLPKRQWRDAVNDFRKAVLVDAKVFGPALNDGANVTWVELPSTADYLFNEAILLATNGVGNSSDQEQALELFERVVTIRQTLLPASHPDMVTTYEAFAKLLAQMDRKSEAEAIEKRAAEARKLQPEKQ